MQETTAAMEIAVPPSSVELLDDADMSDESSGSIEQQQQQQQQQGGDVLVMTHPATISGDSSVYTSDISDEDGFCGGAPRQTIFVETGNSYSSPTLPPLPNGKLPPTITISFSSDAAEDVANLSPSTISCGHSLTDDLILPQVRLPLLLAPPSPPHSSQFSCQNQPLASSSRARRKLEEVDLHLSQHNSESRHQVSSTLEQRSDPGKDSSLSSSGGPTRRRLATNNNNSSSYSSTTRPSSLLGQPWLRQQDQQREQPRRPRWCSYDWRPRFLLMLCASTLVLMSVHDRVETSRRYVASDHAYRHEEVDFPLVVARAAAAASSSSSSSLVGTEWTADTASNGGATVEESRASLPKFYFPKLQQDSAITTSGSGSGGGLRQNRRSSLAMARSSAQDRPVFESGVATFVKRPVEKFYFDDTSGSHSSHNDHEQQRHQYQRYWQSPRRKFLSLTSWVAAIALLSLVLDSGLREYQRCRMYEEEQRRL